MFSYYLIIGYCNVIIYSLTIIGTSKKDLRLRHVYFELTDLWVRAGLLQQKFQMTWDKSPNYSLTAWLAYRPTFYLQVLFYVCLYCTSIAVGHRHNEYIVILKNKDLSTVVILINPVLHSYDYSVYNIV